MSQDQLAELARVLYSPVTLLLYGTGALLYLYALTTKVGRREERERGRKAELAGLVVASLGVAAHIGHEVVRGVAQQRLPLGNMFEFTSLMALVGVLTGLIYLQFVRKRPELNGFVLMAGTLVLASALLVYAEPGPLMPILDTWWRSFHVTVIVSAAGVFTAGFVFNSLHLLRDTAESRVAEARTAEVTGSTVGAAYVDDLERPTSGPEAEAVEPVDPDAPVEPGLANGAAAPETGAVGGGPGSVGGTPGSVGGESEIVEGGDAAVAERVAPDASVIRDDRDHDAEYREALRRAIPVWRLALGTFLGTSLVSWVFIATPTLDLQTGIVRFLTVNLVMVAAALIARWFVPFLPPAATLDGLAYRTIALAFFMWTFGVIAGAMWAEQSWGRFWGWDPKETASFLTWVAYAAYLHARATRGTRGRGAGWIGLFSFAVLMFTYYAVNLVFVGLHSYAGLS